MSTLCRSGRHHWDNEACAERCCDPEWTRVLVAPGDEALKLGDLRTTSRSSIEGLLFVFIRVADLDRLRPPNWSIALGGAP